MGSYAIVCSSSLCAPIVLYGELAEQADIIKKIPASVSAKNIKSKSPPEKNRQPVKTMKTKKPQTKKSCTVLTTTDCFEKSLNKS
jgi:hypothetical protein